MDLYLLNEVNKLKAAGSGPSTSAQDLLYPQESRTTTHAAQTWVAFSGLNNRNHHHNYNWQNNHPSQGYSFYVYGQGWQDMETKWRVPLGPIRTYTNTIAAAGQFSHGLGEHYLKRDHLGPTSMMVIEGRGTNSYTPWGTTIMFVRNKSSSDITVGVQYELTNYWNNGYEGQSFSIYRPNSTEYTSTTTTGQTTNNTSQGWDTIYTSGNTSNISTITSSVTLPANKTSALMLCTNTHYTNNASYWTVFRYACNFQSMKTSFLDNTSLECDLQMSQTYHQARIKAFGDGTVTDYGSAGEQFYRFYNECGAIYGDRT
tara:strand:+ start:884 stop:1828 length:945 start_codon:yes stop_codon:yes gene_type:complete